MPCSQHDSVLLYFRQVLGSIDKFILELDTLHCLLVRAYNKNNGRAGLFQTLQKDRTFHVLWQSGAQGVMSLCGLSSCIIKKRTSSPLQFGLEKNIPGHSIEWRTYWFVLKIFRMFPVLLIRTDSVGIGL